MSITDDSTIPITLYDLEPLDPDLGLYYNRRTHKFEYCSPRSTENTARVGSCGEQHFEPLCSPSIKADLQDVYGEIVPRKQKSVRETGCSTRSCQRKNESVDTSFDTHTTEQTDKKDVDHNRKDPGKELSGVLDPENLALNTQLLGDSPGNAVPNSCPTPSTDNEQHPLAQAQAVSPLQLDARTQSKIACMMPLLSIQGPTNPQLTCIRRVILKHNIIESADNEEIAVPREAATTFNAHEDGSVSIFCSLTLSRATACVCAVEKALETLLKGGQSPPEPEHVSAKREMWRKISVSPRETRNAGVRGPSPLRVSKSGSRLSRRAPVISLVRSFVQLLRPKMGSPRAKEDTIYGVQMFERPICTDEGVDLAGETCCGKAMFHISGEVESAPVDISGFATRYN